MKEYAIVVYYSDEDGTESIGAIHKIYLSI